MNNEINNVNKQAVVVLAVAVQEENDYKRKSNLLMSP